MSRSAFAARFRALVGTTSLDHLTEWQMVRAAGVMGHGRPMKLAAVASAMGYESYVRLLNLSPAIIGAGMWL
jgi:hypothetical protein